MEKHDNMKTTTCSLVAVLACAFSSAAISTVQKPLDVSERHQPKQVMGREYWTYIGSGPHTDPAYSPNIANWNAPWNNAALTNLPVFRDCGLVRHSHRLPPSAKGTSASWRTVKDNCGGNQWQILSSDAKQDRPLVVVLDSKRNVLAMAGDVDLDHDDWAAFKKAHPNLVGTRTMCEWGNDMLLLIPRTTNVLNTARRQELEAVWAKYALTNRYDRLALARWYTDRKLKLHYDDRDTFMAFRGMYFLDHIAAAWGAKTLTAETTNTSSGNTEYRWDISGMFIRGAARRFGVPWCWYEANYFNGPGKDGQWLNNSVCGYRNPRGNSRPEGGTSASAQRRCWYYAYFNGANAVEPESWFGHFFTTNTPSGKAELSDRGKNFSDYHDFTAAHPGRGVTYAPVAILTPFAQGYTAMGGGAWGRCEQTEGDYALNALFFTIAPGWERAKSLKAGIQEGNLHNSRFAMMYDVLVPDSPQPKEDFAKALFAYPAAILVGDYPNPSLFEDVLAAYERAGGRLIRLTADELPPRGKDTHADMLTGRLKFPTIERTLDALQRDLFPFAVTGDCQFGANKTKNGWWLWVFNNKGVRKFADTFETIDHSKDAVVEVEFTKTAVAPVTELMSGRRVEVKGGKFTFAIPAGDFAVFEIGEDATFAVPRAEFAKYYAAATGQLAPPNAVSFAIDPKISKTGKDAYTIVSGSAVTITGSNMRSVMYGVYDLLERRVGCRWFWDGDVVPRCESIDLSNLDIHEEAQFEWRGLRYFAHRGLTRFQAEHWGPDDWKKEIDWCLKRRLNVFMLRIGQDDLFQRTFPDVCAYPDPSKPLPGAGKGYDNRSLFWSLKFRGQLRHDLQHYAFARGLEVPEDFGTMTHWYSRTPEDFLEKKNPTFLPQATRGYAEKNGLVWDIRDDKWADEYWKLTQTAVEAYGKPGDGLLHTIGLGERLCYTNRADNLKIKLLALDKFLSRAHRDYPEKKVLLAGWDFYFTWYPDEVKALVKTLDPTRDIIWDYEGDATRDYRPEMKKIGGNDFTKWGVVGKFPYTYSIFLAFEDGIDIRANYPLIEKRQKIVQNDPACAGYILWPESSHTDTLCLRFFTANAWAKEPIPVEQVLDEFCASRYGAQAAQMKRLWDKVLPVARLREWGGNYGRLLARSNKYLPEENPEVVAKWQEQIGDASSVFRRLADVKWDDAFIRRDTIDLARTTLDRVITLRLYELGRDVAAWRNPSTFAARAKNLAALCDMMADVLALHTDYSLWESYLRLDAVEKVRNPEFTKVLFDNASCGYCRSHQYELARHWYAARMRQAADRLEKAVAANDRTAALFDKSEDERQALMARPLESLRPALPRTEAQYRATMRAIARECK